MIRGWKRSTLGEACTIEKGKASAANEPPGSYPLVTTGAERKNAATWQFEGPAVCVPMISAYGHGKPGLKHVHYQEGKFALANILSALLVKNPKELSAKFLSIFLNFYKDHLIVPLQFGAANMSITVARLAAVPIWYPSLTEQERILCLLDKAEKLRKLREQASTRMEEFVPALFYEMFGDPATNPKNWEIIKLGNKIMFMTSGSRGWAKYYSDRGDLFLRIQNVGENQLLLDDVAYVQAPDTVESKRTRVQAGDLLISGTADLGRTGVIPENFPTAYINQHLFLLRLSDIDPCFVAGYFSTPNGKAQILHSNRAAVKAGLNFNDVKNLSIFNAPLALQREFAQRVQVSREIQARQVQSADRIEALYQSMLSRAFAEEL